MDRYKKKERFVINVIFYCLIGALLVAATKYLLPVLMPFIIGLLVTLLLQPLVRFCAAYQPRLKKVFGIAICAAFYLLCGYLLVNFGVQIVQKAGDLIARIPAMYEQQIVPALLLGYDKLETFLQSIDPSLSKEVDAVFNDLLQNMRVYITEYSMKGVGFLTNMLSTIPGLFIKVLMMIISTFFMMADFDGLTQQALRLIPSERRGAVGTTLGYAKSLIGKYIKSYSLIFFITFMELSIGFALLDIPHAFLFGFCVAIFDILPILGTGGILIPWAIIVALLGNGGLAFGLIFLYIFIVVVRNILEPRIVGKQIGLHPLVTLIGMFVGLKFFGIIGLFGIPITLSIIVNLDRSGIIHVFPQASDSVS